MFRDRPVTWSVPTQDCLEQRKHTYSHTERGYTIDSSFRKIKTVSAVLLKNISAMCSQCLTAFSHLERLTGEVTGVNVMIACIGKLKLGLCHAMSYSTARVQLYSRQAAVSVPGGYVWERGQEFVTLEK